jgi:signal peptidase I
MASLSINKFVSWASIALQAMGCTYILEKHFCIRKGSGQSMYPTYNPYDYIFAEAFSYKYFSRSLKIGDVVIFTSPVNGRELYLKRITALAGDKIRPDETVDFNYGDDEYYRIPYGHIWVEGDNKMESLDSRSYGPVPVNLIRYRVAAKIWPLK